MNNSHVSPGSFTGTSPVWLKEPDDVNDLMPHLWSQTAEKRDGDLYVGGLSIPELVANVNTPAFILDEDDFRSRARAFKEAFAPADVYYAGKSFLCTEVARWIDQEGLCLDVCSDGELTVALRAGFDPERIGYHGNNKTAMELRRAIIAGVGRIIVDSFDEIERIGAITAETGTPARVMIRVTAGVEAHTHEFIATAHEDQKFGFSISSGDAFGAARRILEHPGIDLRGLHSHIGSQIFDTAGFEVAARRVLALHAKIAHELGHVMPETDLGGGFGIAYTSQDDPKPPVELAAGMREIVTQECRGLGIEEPHLSIEPGRAIVGPSMCTVYTVGTVKQVALDGGHTRTYVSVDGGMSDNIRTALYDADYSATLASRTSDAAPVVARIVGKHCESGDIVVKDEFLPSDIRPGDLVAVPATGAYGRSMASNYNHALRPPVVAVKDGVARTLVRRETVEDLLTTDLG
ncbi:diaminopimelate decarboxylase [Nocardioides sp. Kera G14]|uniref:diaminopimelate decarboxylase n=1 Tax=Nocardioides sp. Kera G14 TaxID=2884264 RepID=UPI001D1225FD|nr:diaminopimelate decarboxylase [Nocardioides sp. Kera G14]UDY24714.1 diaminopimelate decarboxylase [Nocardioides sp. Kera G14]